MKFYNHEHSAIGDSLIEAVQNMQLNLQEINPNIKLADLQ